MKKNYSTNKCSYRKLELKNKFACKFWFLNLIFIFLISLPTIKAQTVNTYGFAQSPGTYTANATPTAIAALSAADDAVSALINIGFTFTYHGVAYTKFVASSNGFITLGAAATTTAYEPMTTTANSIAYCARDGKCVAANYKLTGTSPNQVLTIQFQQQLTYLNSSDIVNAQIKLYQTTNVLAIIYGATTKANAYAPQVGITGAATTDFSVRTSTTSWSANNTAAANSATMTWSSTIFPASGQTYTWTPPASCTAPAAPTSNTLTIGSPANGLQHNMTQSFPSVSGAAGYEISYSYDNVTWAAGTNTIFNSMSWNLGDQPNVRFFTRVRAYCGSLYSGYVTSLPLYTACDVAAIPTAAAASSTSGNITLNIESPVANPAITTYAIYCTTTGTHVQASGALGATAVYQTRATWGTILVTGLSVSTSYTFYAIAKNNDGDTRFLSTNTASFVTNCNTSTVNTTISVIEGLNTTSATLGCWRQNGNIFTSTAGTNPTCSPQEGDQMIYFNSYNVAAGTQKRFWSMPLNTSGATGVSVNFYWLNENSTTYTMTTEGVQVQYSTNGGATWTNSGAFFPRQDATLAPGATQWDKKRVEIGAAALGSNVLIGFLFTSQFGNNCFIDNIKIHQAKPIISSISPSPSCTGSTVTINGSHFLNTTAVTFNGMNATSFTIVSATQLTAVIPATATSGLVDVTTLMGGAGTSASSFTINVKPTVTVNSPTICSGASATLTATGASSYSWSTTASTNSISVSPTTTTSYTVTGTSAAGCTATAIATVTVNPLPTVTVNSPTICSGSSATLTAAGASSYSWSTTASTNSILVSPTTTTSYTVTGTSAAGCTATAIATVTVNGAAGDWLGVASSDWFNPSNWCSGIPTAGSTIIIPATAPNMPMINNIGALCNNITINVGATLLMSSTGMLEIKGNWTNYGTFTPSGGTISFNGSSAQLINGATNFSTLVLDNNTGLTLGTSSNISISNYLNLINGLIVTNTNQVTILGTAGVAVTNGYVNGYLKKYVDAVSSAYQTFEVGSNLGYTPAALYFNNVTTAGYLTVNTVSTDHPNISSSGLNATKTVNRYWNFVNAGVGFDTYSADLNYLPTDTDPGFISMYAGAKIFNGGSWSLTAQQNSSSNFVSVTGATVIGSIQIGVFNPIPLAATITPSIGYITQTMNITIGGSGFINGVTSLNAVSGVTINSTTVNNDSTLTLNISIASAALPGIRKFAITNSAIFGGVSFDSLIFNVKGHPVANFFANKPVIPCFTSENVEFNNYSTFGSSYYWDFGAGATPSTATGDGPFIVNYSSIGYKTIKLIAFSPIGNDTIVKINHVLVKASAPAVAASITGPLSICSYGTSNVLYKVPNLLSAVTTYTWTIPAGVTIITGQGTYALVVSFSSSFSSGIISVKQTNGCGTGPSRSITVTAAPPVPGVISGPTNLCSLSSANYSVAAVTGATSYVWTLPANATSSLGASPITTLTPNISVTIGSSFISGTLSVSSKNSCAASAARTLVIAIAPPSPSIITGTAVSCGLTTASYSITAISGAISYTWTLPSGMTSSLGVSPITTTATTMPVTIASTFTSGNITVKANGNCASSVAKTLFVSQAPPAPGAITGPSIICGVATTTYSIAAIASATNYTWTLPAGITSTLGSSPITTTLLSIPVSISGFTSGSITVKANNSCASSAVRSLVLSNAPALPGVITGPTNICGISVTTFSIANVASATSFTWTTPTGVTIVSGQGTTSILVSVVAGVGSGNISVVSNNACTSSASKILALAGCHSYQEFSDNDSSSVKQESRTLLYPNPSIGEFNIEYHSESNSELIIEMYNVEGKKIFTKKESTFEGINTFYNNESNLGKGVYFIKIIDMQNNKVETKNIIIQ